MLEIICATSIAFSLNVYQSPKPIVNPIVKETVGVLDVTRQNVASAQKYLAQSQYRREVDEDSERHEIDSPDQDDSRDENYGDRYYRDADERRRADENTREEEDVNFDYRREEPRRDNSDEIEDLESQKERLERQIEELKHQQDSNRERSWFGF
jgi:hypothetical protein